MKKLYETNFYRYSFTIFAISYIFFDYAFNRGRVIANYSLYFNKVFFFIPHRANETFEVIVWLCIFVAIGVFFEWVHRRVVEK